MTRIQPNSLWGIGRSAPGENTIEPIITGNWNDGATWLETGKFWWDNGSLGTQWTGRTQPTTVWN